MSPEALSCAANNVDWYRAVLPTHGLAGDVADGVFICLGEVPPCYSNAVAFSPVAPERQIQRIAELVDKLGRPFSVNDCFARLPLETLGFQILFEAQWIWRDTNDGAPSHADRMWQRIVDETELRDWETAWRAFGSPTERRAFLPQLLSNSSVALFAVRDRHQIRAVCAANRSDTVVGLSNFFTREGEDAVFLLREALAEVGRFAPGLPVVGYEHGEALTTAERVGFRAVGPLRIWLISER